MRRPFLCLLVLLSIYCWLNDVVAYVFFCARSASSYQGVVGVIAGIAGVLALGYALKDLLRPVCGKAEWGWFLLAALPIIGLGLFRSVYPDQNFDTFHFELYLQDYKLPENKLNFAPGAIRTYYFPLPERMFALSRHLLGYRLGALSLIDAFVTMNPFPKDGLAKLLNPRVPIYDLLDYGRTPELTDRFERDVIRPDSVHNLVTVTYPEEWSHDTSALRVKGYGVTHIDTVYPRFMKAGQPVFLLRIRYLDTGKAATFGLQETLQKK